MNPFAKGRPRMIVEAFTRIVPALLLTLVVTPVLGGKSFGLIGPGMHPVASTHLEIGTPVSGSLEQYLNGNTGTAGMLYVSSLLINPSASLFFEVRIPADPALYGKLSGTIFPVVAVMTYPTTADNPRLPYSIPLPRELDRTLPAMDMPGDQPVVPDPQSRLPLILHCHGLQSNPVYDLAESKFLSSHGYAVASVFYGDGRTADARVQSTLRTFLTRATIDYLLGHPVYGKILDPDTIGTTGIAFGGYNSLAIMGARYQNHPSSVVDSRVVAGFAVVPWMISGTSHPFGSAYRPLESVSGAWMSVVAGRDTSADPSLVNVGLQLTRGPTFVFTLANEQHALSNDANLLVRTLKVLFLDAYVKKSTSAQNVLSRITSVDGGVPNSRTLARNAFP
jgi:hypothetical protein